MLDGAGRCQGQQQSVAQLAQLAMLAMLSDQSAFTNVVLDFMTNVANPCFYDVILSIAMVASSGSIDSPR